MFLENQNLVVYGDRFQKYYLIGSLYTSHINSIQTFVLRDAFFFWARLTHKSPLNNHYIMIFPQ